jgi:hypothetical protein
MDVRQAEIHTVEPLVPEPSAFEVELAIENLKNHKSPGIDQIPAELIKAGGRTIRDEIPPTCFGHLWWPSSGRRSLEDMIYLLTAIGLTPGGSSTVHIYTQSIHITT